MQPMLRARPILSTLLLLCTPFVLDAQIPPGDPYDATRHVNPVLTYVDKSSFKDATFEDAQTLSGTELLGISQQQGKREGVRVADAGLRKVKILGRNTEVTFYPAVERTYRLTDGTPLTLYSFKFPKLPIPPEVAGDVLHQDAVRKTKKPSEARLGTSPAPEQSEVRGSTAFLFDDGGVLTIFWVEGRHGHIATAKMDRRRFFRLLETLL